MPHTRVWVNTQPPNTQAITQGALRIREFRTDIQERMQIDHVWAADVNTDGYHSKVSLPERADPANVANIGILYSKDVAGLTQLHYIDSAGTVSRLSGTLDGVVVPWALLSNVPTLVDSLGDLADPGADSYLKFNNVSNLLEFETIPPVTTFCGYVDSAMVTEQLPAGWTVAADGSSYKITHGLGLSGGDRMIVVATAIGSGGHANAQATEVDGDSFSITGINDENGVIPINFFFIAKILEA